MEQGIKGYKAFNPDWTCRRKQYTCPGKFEEDVGLKICESGMHFCKKLHNCFYHYRFSEETKIAEVIAYGNILEEGDKCCTDKLEIIRELPWKEVLEKVNFGKDCSGLANVGDKNIGNGNLGRGNTGHWNIGNGNKGTNNVGDRNVGRKNLGDQNVGNHNSGDQNIGSENIGNLNKGEHNTGDENTGDYNVGNGNKGDYNTGNGNVGDGNSGSWNKCNFSSGCFNTSPEKIRMFNKPSDWTYEDFKNSRAGRVLSSMPSSTREFVSFYEMTEQERKTCPNAKITAGCLKALSKTEREKQRRVWWKGLAKPAREAVLSLPNFDADIFREITGIDVNVKEENETDA